MLSTGNEFFDAFSDGVLSLTTGAQLIPAWSPDGTAMAFIDGSPDDRQGWLVDLATGERSGLLDVQKLRESLRAATGETPAGQGLPFAHLAFVGPRTVMAQVGSHRVTIDLTTAEATVVPAEAPTDVMFGMSQTARCSPREYQRTQPLVDPQPAFETVSPDGSLLVSTRDGNLVLRGAYDGRESMLTTDGTPEHEWRFDMFNPMLAALGMAVPVTNWSPDGSRLAAYRVDNAGVAQHPQVHYLGRTDEAVFRYGAQAGGILERSTLHLLDVYGQPRVELDLGDTTDTYPVFAGWSPDGASMIVFQMSRDCRRVDILLADTVTGAVRLLFTESGETFVRIHHDIYYGRKLGLTLTPEGSELLWLSERSGWKQIYVYDLGGALVRQLTDADWPVDEVKLVRDGWVYFSGRGDQSRPYDLHLYRVPLAGGPTEPLTAGEGVHSVIFSPTGEQFLDTCSTPGTAPVHRLVTAAGVLLTEVLTADVAALTDMGWTPPRQFTVKAADGETDLWGVIFFPLDFDESKSYPVIEYVYGGPQIAVAPHSFGGGFGRYAEVLAKLGCISVMLDARGTPERSKAFHDVVYRSWSGHLADDHAEALKQLADRHAFIDLSRGAGVAGHSWGGYTTFRLLVDRPDVYTAGVASASGFDPYSSVLYECYLGLPQTDKAAYDAAQNLTLADRLESALMIVCGTSDHNTWSDSMKMTEALIRAGKDHEFVVLPEQYHGYGSVHDSYYWRKASRFFSGHLSIAES